MYTCYRIKDALMLLLSEVGICKAPLIMHLSSTFEIDHTYLISGYRINKQAFMSIRGMKE